MRFTRTFILGMLTLAISLSAWGQASVNEGLETAFIYVDAAVGSDSNPGTITQPLRTIGAAVNMAETNNQKSVGSRVIINPGVYREAVTVAPNNHTTSLPITFESAINGTVFVSGAQRYTGWKTYSQNSNIFTHSWPYAWGLCTPYASAGAVPDIVLRREMVFVNGTPLTQVLSLGEMTVPATFSVDETGGTLYIWPPTGINLSTADVEIATEPTVWTMQGQSNLVVRGLAFEYGNPCRENAQVMVYSAGTAENVLFDSDSFLWSNAQGLNISPVTSYFTVQNSIANHNGEAGFQANKVKYGLYQSDQVSYNNWRGAQGAYYRYNNAGIHYYQMHDLTLDDVSVTYNQTYGTHLDTDNYNVTVTSFLAFNNLLTAFFVERSEGPVVISGSTLCGGNPAGYQSNRAFVFRGSESVTLTGNNLANSNGVTVTGPPGGFVWTNWETGQQYFLDNQHLTLTQNVIEAGSGQSVFSDSSLGGTDWTNFQSTLASDYNTWWDASNSTAFTVPTPKNNTAENFSGWQSTSGQDHHSTWADPTVNPAAACSGLPDMTDYWFVIPFSASPAIISAGGTATFTATVVPLSFTGTVQLSSDGLQSIAGATGSWSAHSVGPNQSAAFTVTTASSTAPGTYPIVLIANSGNLTRTITVLLTVS